MFKLYEVELDKINKFIKEFIKDGKLFISVFKNLFLVKWKFVDFLNEFKF